MTKGGLVMVPGRLFGMILSSTLILFALVTTGFAQPCLDYGDYAHWVAGIITPAPSSGDLHGYMDVVVSGDYAYNALHNVGLEVIDISDPLMPEIVSTTAVSEYPWITSVDVAGNYAYLVNEPSSTALIILDVTDPTTPVFTGDLTLSEHYFHTVTISGNHAFLGNNIGLRIVNVTDPTTPQLVGNVDTPGMVDCIAIEGDFAYVADWHPSNPAAGLQVVDISDLTNPQLVSSTPIPGDASSVTVAGSYAYVTARNSFNGLHIIDVSSPTSPEIVGSYEGIHSPRDVTVAGDLAYVAANHAIEIIEVKNPTAPQYQARVEMPAFPRGIALRDNYLFVAELGDYAAFLYPPYGGLQIVDVTHPISPAWVGETAIAGGSDNPVIKQDHAFLAGLSAGLICLDITNPSIPVTVSVTDIGGRARTVAVDENLAYLGASSSFPSQKWIQVVDVTDPTAPVVRGQVNGFTASGIAAAGQHAFAVNSLGQLLAINASDPDSPFISDDITFSGDGREIALAGDFVYVAAGWEGIHVFDISDPTAMQWVYTTDTPDYAEGVVVDNRFVYIADGFAGLQIIDVNDTMNPQTPLIVGMAASPGYSYNVATWAGTGAYLVSFTCGLLLFDIRDPSEPTILGGIDCLWANGVTFGNGYIFTVSVDFRVAANHCFLPSAVEPFIGRARLFQNHPNPFNPSTSIEFAVPNFLPVKLKVYGVDGRYVSTLTDNDYTPGPHSVTWNGKDDQGRPVASGTYIYRLEAGEYVESKRMVLVR